MDFKKRLLRIISVLCIFSLLSVGFLIPAHHASAASVIIDTFNDDYTFYRDGVGTSARSFSSLPVPGGVRKVKIDITSGTGRLSTDTTPGSPTGTFSISSATGVTGTVTIAYDHSAESPDSYNLDRNGMSASPIDLKDDNTNTALYFSIPSDDRAVNITVDIYSSDTSCSRLVRKTPGSVYTTTDVPVALVFPFTSFTSNCSAGANFASVSAIEITIVGLENLDMDFRLLATGNVDYGDAYKNAGNLYNTVGRDTGTDILIAGHLIDPNLKLGTLIDGESTGQPNLSATGDDINGSDDEDGVSFTSAWQVGSNTGGHLTVNVTGTGCLYGWIDWIYKGYFVNSNTTLAGGYLTGGDRIINASLVTSGTWYFDFPVPSDSLDAPAYKFVNARFRLYPRDPDNTCTSTKYPDQTSTTGQGVVVLGGEVEDYRWYLDSPTAVNMTDYHTSLAQPTGLTIQWTTIMETDTAGFNLYRAEELIGTYTKINSSMIPPQTPGQPSGNTYTYMDTTALPGVEYSYKLEHVAADTSTSEYGVTTGVFYHTLIPLIKH